MAKQKRSSKREQQDARFWRQLKFWGDLGERFETAPEKELLAWVITGAKALGHDDLTSALDFWANQIKTREIAQEEGTPCFRFRRVSAELARRVRLELIYAYAPTRALSPVQLSRATAVGKLGHQALSIALEMGAQEKALEVRWRTEGALPIPVIADAELANFRQLGETLRNDLADPHDLEKGLPKAQRSLQTHAEITLDHLADLGAGEALQEEFRKEWTHQQIELERRASALAAQVAQEEKRAEAVAEILRNLKDESGMTFPELAWETKFSERQVGRHLAYKNPVPPSAADLKVYDQVFTECLKRDICIQKLLQKFLAPLPGDAH